jgi:subtilisin
LYNQVKNAGNFNWTDDSGDGIKEPLLDVSNTTLFNPVLVAGSGGGTPPPSNNPPTAEFTNTTTGLTVIFTDQSFDSDGSVVAWSWSFGDGSTSTDQDPTHIYSNNGTYTVSLTVTDDDDSTGSTSKSVTVSSNGAEEINLSVTAYKVRGTKYADLTWNGATTSVNVYRDGTLIKADISGTEYSDGPLGKGGGSATYQVCEAGTSTCSNEVIVSW